jgi:hypothetical protein
MTPTDLALQRTPPSGSFNVYNPWRAMLITGEVRLLAIVVAPPVLVDYDCRSDRASVSAEKKFRNRIMWFSVVRSIE